MTRSTTLPVVVGQLEAASGTRSAADDGRLGADVFEQERLARACSLLAEVVAVDGAAAGGSPSDVHEMAIAASAADTSVRQCVPAFMMRP